MKLFFIGLLVLAVSASAQTPTPTPTATPPLAEDCDPHFTTTPTAISTPTPTIMPTAIPSPAVTPSIMLILLNAPNGDSRLTAQEAEEFMFTNTGACIASVSAYNHWFKSTHGILQIDGQTINGPAYNIFGPYESTISIGGGCQWLAWGAEGKTLALESGDIDQDDWDDTNFKMFILPVLGDNTNECSAGLGFVGGNKTYITNGSPTDESIGWVMSHELGHNFNFPSHYPDPVDLNGSNGTGLSAQNMIQGARMRDGQDYPFMPTESVVEISNEGQQQQFTLLPSSLDPYPNHELRVVKIAVQTGDPYYISFRDDTGMDACIQTDNRLCEALNDPYTCCIDEDQGTCNAELAVSIARANVNTGGGLEIMEWLKDGETYTPDDNLFQIEVTDISESATWEAQLTVTFLEPTGTLAWQP